MSVLLLVLENKRNKVSKEIKSLREEIEQERNRMNHFSIQNNNNFHPNTLSQFQAQQQFFDSNNISGLGSFGLLGAFGIANASKGIEINKPEIDKRLLLMIKH